MESFVLKKLQEFAEDSTSSDSSYSECQSSSEDEELLRESLDQLNTLQNNIQHHNSGVKIKSYIDNIPICSDGDFKSLFRISRSSLEKLMRDIQRDVRVIGRPRVPLKEALLATIWMLTTQESLKCVGDRFGLSKGHLHRVFVKTCEMLTTNIHKYINWPMGQEASTNVDLFNNLSGKGNFQGVFGCVDATHIPIPGPITDTSYYNRSGFHSVILQGICNAKMEFMHVFAGWPGSSQPDSVWTNSEIYKCLQADMTSLLPAGTFLIGSTAYPLDKFLMVPFKDNGHLAKKQCVFNEKLSSIRVIIDQAFDRLTGQFRKLKYINVLNLEYVKYIILSACILHNISIKDDVTYVNEEPDIEEPESVMVDCSVSDNPEATLLRNDIMDALSS